MECLTFIFAVDLAVLARATRQRPLIYGYMGVLINHHVAGHLLGERGKLRQTRFSGGLLCKLIKQALGG